MRKFPAKLEFEAVKATILEESLDEITKDPTMRVQVKWQHGNVINRNGREYPTKLLKREIDRLQEQLNNGEIYGASYHPDSGIANVGDVSHIWNKIWIADNGECFGEATVLPTDQGKNAMILIKHGKLGVSSRGAGTVTQKTKMVNGVKTAYDEVNADFRLMSPGDFVLTPSVPGAEVRAVMENSISDAVHSYIKENKNLFTESQDEPGISKKNKQDGETMSYENIEALMADNEDLFKKYEKGQKAEMKKLTKEKKEEWTKEVEEKLSVAVEAVKKSNEAIIEGIRDAINVLTGINGVIPEEDDTDVDKDKDKDKDKKENEKLAKSVADLEQQTADLKKQISDKEVAEKDAVDKKESQKVMKTKLDEELAKDENIKYKSLIETELINEAGEVKFEDVDKLPKEIERLKVRFSAIFAEGIKNQILEAGIAPLGTVKKTDKPKDTDADAKVQFTEAKKAGYKGTFDEYKSNILSMNS